ncbi:unnamed protein product [Rotaria magnacalcarata]|uniref:Apple domain-containing protein n=1 Tax=Rotaria magnacalcarata TaxID=392030 RepID=A0A816MH55_9BILA|nr:unnamed protein product [Rotaria magnacalcarata]
MAISVTMYTNARFDPFNINNTLANLISISSVNVCLCQCYNNSICLTANYFFANQTCSLYSAQLSGGWLRVVPTSTNAQVLSFSSTVSNITTITTTTTTTRTTTTTTTTNNNSSHAMANSAG